jgi:glutamate N-acetyltransferase/amino-acid N-acetyltransferase
MTDPTTEAAPGKPGLMVSPLAVALPEFGQINGVRLATGRAGFYKHERPDLLLMAFDEGSTAAGVFTLHGVGSAPVDWCKDTLGVNGGVVRALVCNAGCANSFTGQPGADAARTTAEAAATALGVPSNSVMLASTGVIGVVLEAAKIEAVMPDLASGLSQDRWADAATAIMTTDTFAKGAVAETTIDGVKVRVAGIAKGSGMIAPNMATMLAFVATDAAIAAPALQDMLSHAVVDTFNAVTVDGDRSTNDTCLVIATGKAGHAPVAEAADPRLAGFKVALRQVLLSLAQQLVRDGEGANKFVAVTVSGAASDASARKIARTICESPLVKTAIAGEDANWGRLVMAVGRADEPIAREKIAIHFGPLLAAVKGMVAPDYDEAAMSAYMKHQELEISVDVGVGTGLAVMWTCDLTKRYIEINGDYRS